MVHATAELNPALNNADALKRAAHDALATAVAKGDDYSKEIDESNDLSLFTPTAYMRSVDASVNCKRVNLHVNSHFYVITRLAGVIYTFSSSRVGSFSYER